MLFEKYLQKLLGLRLALYEAPEGVGLPRVEDKISPKYMNPEVQELSDNALKDEKISPETKAKLQETLKKIDNAYSQLRGVSAGQKIIGKRLDILGTVTKIGDPKDTEYQEIIKRIEELKKESTELTNQQADINKLVDQLKKDFEALSGKGGPVEKGEMNERNKKLLQVLGISESDKNNVEVNEAGVIVGIKKDTKLKITLDAKEAGKDVTIGRLIPVGVSEITYEGKKYTRLGKSGEFINDKKEFLKIFDTKEMIVSGTRTPEQLKTLDEGINAGLESASIRDKVLTQKAREHGMDEQRVKTLFEAYLENAKRVDEPIDGERLEKDEAYVGVLVEQCIFAETLTTNSYKISDIVDDKNPEAVRRLVEQRVAYDRRNNPSGWVKSTFDAGKNAPAFLKVINELFFKFTGIDLFGLNPEEQQRAREYMGNMVGGAASGELGSLSERFESEGKGSAVIEADKDAAGNSFYSYGTYQINREKLKLFVSKNANYLGLQGVQIDPKWYSSAEKEGNPIYKAWSEKAASDPKGFKKLEQAFVKESYFDPVINAVKGQVDFTKFPMMVQNVVWSTAVQHGEGSANSQSGAIPIVKQALASIGGKLEPNDFAGMRKFVEAVYRIRASYRNSTPARYEQEKAIVMANLDIVENTGKLEVGTASSEDLAKFMESTGYKCFEGGAMCGKNVGEMLFAFAQKLAAPPTNKDSLLKALKAGMKGRRDGYRYTEFFETPPLNKIFESRTITNPMQADRGGIVVYDRGYGIGDRNGFGHVEIATGGGRFYFGKHASRPGGSINAAANPGGSGFTGKVYYLRQNPQG